MQATRSQKGCSKGETRKATGTVAPHKEAPGPCHHTRRDNRTGLETKRHDCARRMCMCVHCCVSCMCRVVSAVLRSAALRSAPFYVACHALHSFIQASHSRTRGTHTHSETRNATHARCTAICFQNVAHAFCPCLLHSEADLDDPAVLTEYPRITPEELGKVLVLTPGADGTGASSGATSPSSIPGTYGHRVQGQAGQWMSKKGGDARTVQASFNRDTGDDPKDRSSILGSRKGRRPENRPCLLCRKGRRPDNRPCILGIRVSVLLRNGRYLSSLSAGAAGIRNLHIFCTLLPLLCLISRLMARILMDSRPLFQNVAMDCRVQQFCKVPHSLIEFSRGVSQVLRILVFPPVSARSSSKVARQCDSIRAERSSNGCSLDGSTGGRKG